MRTPPAIDDAAFGRHAPRGLTATLLRIARLPSPGWAGLRVSFFCRALGILMLRGRPLDVQTLGARMRLYPAHNQSEKNLLFTPHLFDAEERDILASRITDGFVFVDIGANVGGYSLFVAALAGPNARILAIEPQPAIFERLVFNIRQNPFGTIKALECAVTDKDGSATLFLDPSNNGQSSVRFVNTARGGVHVQVAARTLKSVLAHEGLDRIQAMKIDVEGAEELILEPFFRDVDPISWPDLLILDDPGGRFSDVLPVGGDAGGYRLLRRTRSNGIYERTRGPDRSPEETGS